MHIVLSIKVIYWIQILLENKIILYCFSYSFFIDEQSKFLILQFWWNKHFKHTFIYERKLK